MTIMMGAQSDFSIKADPNHCTVSANSKWNLQQNVKCLPSGIWQDNSSNVSNDRKFPQKTNLT